MALALRHGQSSADIFSTTSTEPTAKAKRSMSVTYVITMVKICEERDRVKICGERDRVKICGERDRVKICGEGDRVKICGDRDRVKICGERDRVKICGEKGVRGKSH